MSTTLDAAFMTDDEFGRALEHSSKIQIRRIITQIDNFVGKTVHDLEARRQKAVDRFNSHIL